MDKSKKQLIVVSVIFIIALIVFSFSITNIGNSFEKEKNNYEKHIGENFIMGNDTLTIIDYSILSETFTLSNGKEVNRKLIFNKK